MLSKHCNSQLKSQGGNYQQVDNMKQYRKRIFQPLHISLIELKVDMYACPDSLHWSKKKIKDQQNKQVSFQLCIISCTANLSLQLLF